MRTGRRLVVWTVGLAIVAVPTVAVAQASGEDAPLALDRLGPGISRAGSVSVTNPSTEPVTLTIATLNLTDDDDGCVLPEKRAGDTTCGEGGGELSQWLEVTVSADGQQLWSGPFRQLHRDQELPGSLDPGESKSLDITVGVPFEAGNDIMTDEVGFDLRIRTLGDTGEDVADPEVLGAQASTGQHAHPSVSVPTLVEAGLVGPIVTAADVLTNDLPLAVLAVFLMLALGLSWRVIRSSRGR